MGNIKSKTTIVEIQIVTYESGRKQAYVEEGSQFSMALQPETGQQNLFGEQQLAEITLPIKGFPKTTYTKV